MTPGILNNRSLYYLDELKKRALSLTKSVCFKAIPLKMLLGLLKTKEKTANIAVAGRFILMRRLVKSFFKNIKNALRFTAIAFCGAFQF